MAEIYFKYGSGKSADLCETAYNYSEYDKYTIIINAKDNKKIVSKYKPDENTLLERDVNLILDRNNLYNQIYDITLKREVSAVLIDNSEYLSVSNANDLLLVAKILDIDVIAYGNRMYKNNKRSVGSLRLMEIADKIEEIDRNYIDHVNSLKDAYLEFYYGAMNSSKSAKLLFLASELEKTGYKVYLIKPKSDREEKVIKSRIGMKKEANLVVEASTEIYSLISKIKDNIDYILVDEAQFLTVKQIDDLKKITRDFDIPVRCYGLKTDFLTKHFEGSGRLLEISDRLVKLRTICPCGKGASFNARRYSDGTYAKEGNQVVIDSGSNYISLCSECYLEKVMGIDIKNNK